MATLPEHTISSYTARAVAAMQAELDGTPGLGNLPFAVELEGPLAVETLEAALTAVVARHPALRMRFAQEDDELTAAQLGPDEVEPVELAVEAVEGEDELAARIAAHARVPLALGRPPLRTALLQVGADRHVLVVVLHRAVADAGSIEVVLRDVAHAYGALGRGGAGPVLDPAPDPGPHLAAEAVAMAQGASAAFAHWTPLLNGLTEAARLAPSPHAGAPGPARVASVLAPELRRGLRALAKRRGVPLRMVLTALVQVLQHVYVGRREEGVATLIELDHRDDALQGAVGPLTSEAPLLAQPAPQLRFSELLERMVAAQREVLGLRAYPFGELVRQFARPDRQSPLWPQVAVECIEPMRTAWDVDGVRMTLRPDLAGPGPWPGLRVRWIDDPAGLGLVLEYDTAFLHPAGAARMLGQLEALARGVTGDADCRVSDLDPLTPSERQRLLVEWNATEVDHGAETFVELFAAQARRTPDHVAVVSGAERITYRELAERVRVVAQGLWAAGVEPGAVVALDLDRTVEMAVATLAVLHAGAAYVPFDPRHPVERLSFAAQDSSAVLRLTQRSRLERWVDDGLASRCVEDLLLEPHDPDAPGLHVPGPEDVAYVMQTSGSTGRPKGVRVLHGGLANLVRTMADRPGIGPDDVFLSITTMAFDVGQSELLCPLTVGATVVLGPTGVGADPTTLLELMDAVRPTIMFASPATWRLVVDAGWPGGAHAPRIMVGGEALPPDVARDLVERAPEVWNIYGPAETTVFSTTALIDDPDRVVIGRPVSNTRLYVVDVAGHPVPIGAEGELWIGGRGVGDGYVGRPELTARRFGTDPFVGSGRIYRTGDVVRYRDDGQLEFRGRTDDQVKIRGNRVEPGEVSVVLGELPGVAAAQVVAREDTPGHRRLVGYVVPEPGVELNPPELREGLGKLLPDYMVPVAFVTLDELPLNANGKIDRPRLPAPDERSDELERGYVAPRTPLEALLTEIWAQVLGVEHIGVEDSFLDLGGDSIDAAGVLGGLQEELGIQVPLRLLRATPTVAELAAALEREGLVPSGG
jgi:amino acid adenylation domain-containing protein